MFSLWSFFFFKFSPVLISEVHSVRAGRHLATRLNVLVQQHFDLASTTITNIPMKVSLYQQLCVKVAVPFILNLFNGFNVYCNAILHYFSLYIVFFFYFFLAHIQCL